MSTWDARSTFINNYTDSYFGRPIYWPDGRLAHKGLDPFHQDWRARQHDEWAFRKHAAEEWETMYPSQLVVSKDVVIDVDELKRGMKCVVMP